MNESSTKTEAAAEPPVVEERTIEAVRITALMDAIFESKRLLNLTEDRIRLLNARLASQSISVTAWDAYVTDAFAQGQRLVTLLALVGQTTPAAATLWQRLLQNEEDDDDGTDDAD